MVAKFASRLPTRLRTPESSREFSASTAGTVSISAVVTILSVAAVDLSFGYLILPSNGDA